MKQLILLLCCCSCLAACVNWDITGPAGPEGPQGPPGQKPPGTDTSSICGRVFTFNEFTIPIWPVDSVKVTLYLSADSTLETMADTSGFYQFNGIGTGTYNLTFSRNAFGTMKVFGLSHISGGTLNSFVPNISIGQIPVQTVIDNFWIENTTYGTVLLRYNGQAPPSFPEFQQNSRNFELYFSKNANVSETDYLLRSDQLSIQKTTLDKYFAPGDSMYVRVYMVPKYFFREFIFWSGVILWYDQMRPGIYYVDPATGATVYPFRATQSALAATIYN